MNKTSQQTDALAKMISHPLGFITGMGEYAFKTASKAILAVFLFLTVNVIFIVIAFTNGRGLDSIPWIMASLVIAMVVFAVIAFFIYRGIRSDIFNAVYSGSQSLIEKLCEGIVTTLGGSRLESLSKDERVKAVQQAITKFNVGNSSAQKVISYLVKRIPFGSLVASLGTAASDDKKSAAAKLQQAVDAFAKSYIHKTSSAKWMLILLVVNVAAQLFVVWTAGRS